MSYITVRREENSQMIKNRITKKEAEAVASLYRRILELREEGEVTAERTAAWACRYNPGLDYDQVCEDLKQAERIHDYFGNVYEKLSKNRDLTVVDLLEEEFPEDMPETQKKGYYQAAYSIFSLKEETPEEVAERAKASLDEQRSMLNQCLEECGEKIFDDLADWARENRLSEKLNQNRGTAVSAGGGEEVRDVFLYMACVYISAKSGAIGEEWSRPEMLGCMSMSREIILEKSQAVESDWEKEKDTVFEIIKAVILVILCVLAVYLLWHGSVAFMAMMTAAEAGVTGAALTAYLVLEVVGVGVLYLAMAAGIVGALISGVGAILLVVEELQKYSEGKKQVLEDKAEKAETEHTEYSVRKEEDYEDKFAYS